MSLLSIFIWAIGLGLFVTGLWYFEISSGDKQFGWRFILVALSLLTMGMISRDAPVINRTYINVRDYLRSINVHDADTLPATATPTPTGTVATPSGTATATVTATPTGTVSATTTPTGAVQTQAGVNVTVTTPTVATPAPIPPPTADMASYAAGKIDLKDPPPGKYWGWRADKGTPTLIPKGTVFIIVPQGTKVMDLYFQDEVTGNASTALTVPTTP